MARAIRDHASETLATKADLRELELRLEARLARARDGLEQKLADVQIGLIKWFTGIDDRPGRCDRRADQTLALSPTPAPRRAS